MVAMRSPLLLSILLAATTVACNQSLTPTMTGTGGTGATGGDTGGTTGLGSGGVSGKVAAACAAFTAEYQSAVAAAETCRVGASGQCQQSVPSALGGCSCPTYVTDSSALTTIRGEWDQVGCQGPTATCEIFCPAALNYTCISTDGGSTGFCSYAPGTGGSSGTGATGGTTGAGGSPADGGPSNCGTFASEYAAVLIGARTCTAGAVSQCGQQVPTSLSACSSNCTEFVTDSSVLNSIRDEWKTAGCGNVPVACPLFVCATAAGAACVPSDAGGSVCSTSYGTFASD
jgi:hypothetical protein